MTSPCPRFLPQIELPGYRHVPGVTPHPYSDPAGHHFEFLPAGPDIAFDPWWQCRPYLLGLDLFNTGYYWEAHEQWEKLWHATGRRGERADFFKALIQLAVIGVKWHQSKFEMVQKHVQRANDLLARIDRREIMGLCLADLRDKLASIDSKNPPTMHLNPTGAKPVSQQD